MVHLTFIKQTELCAYGWFLPKNIHLVYSLARFLNDAYGKPSALVVAQDDSCIAVGKLVNLVFRVHGIQVTEALSNAAQVGQSETFIQNLLSKADVQKTQHIVVVLPKAQFEKFVQNTSLFLLGCVNSADNWRNMYISAQKFLISSSSVPHYQIYEDLLNRFIDSVNLSSFA